MNEQTKEIANDILNDLVAYLACAVSECQVKGVDYTVAADAVILALRAAITDEHVVDAVISIAMEFCEMYGRPPMRSDLDVGIDESKTTGLGAQALGIRPPSDQ